MLRKKGASHVDWVISIGLFLLYLVTLFVILKPGIEESYDGNTLLFIVKENFKESTTWTVKEVPLFIKVNCNKDAEITPSISVTIQDADWVFSKIEPTPSETFTLLEKSFTIEDDNQISQNTYFLTYYPNKQNPFAPRLELSFQPSSCEVELGITKDLKGISPSWWSNLQSSDYAEIKSDWNYPASGDFLIKLERATIEEFGKKEIPQQVNVFVREWKDYIVDYQKNIEEVKVSIQVW